MAYEWHVVAVEWHQARYRVIAEDTFNGPDGFDWAAFVAAYPLRDVTGETQYVDQVTAVSPDQLRPFVLGAKARTFLDLYANGAFVLLVHRAELVESGLPD